MAAKQANNIGTRSVKDPVISVTKMMPGNMAGTTAVKTDGIPTKAKAAGLCPPHHSIEKLPMQYSLMLTRPSGPRNGLQLTGTLTKLDDDKPPLRRRCHSVR
jgi:hypothetical protein